MIKSIKQFFRNRQFKKDVAREIAGFSDCFVARNNDLRYLSLPNEYVWKVKGEAITQETLRLNKEIEELTA